MRENIVFERHTGRVGMKSAALLSGVVLVGGLLAASSTASAVLPPKTPVDLSVSNTASLLNVGRAGVVHQTVSVSNLSASAAPAELLITVVAGTESNLSVASGLVCDAPVPTTTGYTRACHAASLAAGGSRSVTFDLTPYSDPLLHSLSVAAVVSVDKSMPLLWVDPNLANNKMKTVTKILDVVDLEATVSGDVAVYRLANESITAGITNHGPDPIYAKFRVTVMNGLDAGFGFTADAGLTCGTPVVNSYGTGFYRACTTDSPLASGATLQVSMLLTPTPDGRYHTMNVTGAATKTGATITDSNLTNNKLVFPVAITDGI
jgi:hypothetical protein